MKHVRNPIVFSVLAALGLLAAPRAVITGANAFAQPPAREAAAPGRMGGYQVVENWPKPLPDTDLSHDGWTWGSGCGAWAERPDKVWICQRGEIELPPNAKPWTFAGLLTPPRTNTGRWPYSGNTPRFKLRRHHVIFAVDGAGNTIEEWLQHDKYLAPPQASGPGSVSRGPHKLLMNPYDPEKHIWIVDDDMHEINVFTNKGKLVKTMGVRGVPGRGPNNFNRVTDIAWLPDGTFFVADGYAGVRVAKYDKNGNFLLDWGVNSRLRIRRILDRTSSGPSTASGSVGTGGSSSRIASITGCRSSTRTASFSTCGPPAITQQCWRTS